MLAMQTFNSIGRGDLPKDAPERSPMKAQQTRNHPPSALLFIR